MKTQAVQVRKGVSRDISLRYGEDKKSKHTKSLGRLIRDGDFADDGPFLIMLHCLVASFVDVVRNASRGQALAEVVRERLPGGMGFLAATQEQFDFDAELKGGRGHVQGAHCDSNTDL